MNNKLLVMFIFLTLLSISIGILVGSGYKDDITEEDINLMQDKIDSLYDVINEPVPELEPETIIEYRTNYTVDPRIDYLEDKLNRTESLINDMNETVEYWHDKYKNKKRSLEKYLNPSPVPGY